MTRVASYCRVSTDREDQANSFEAQQRYFTEYIRRQEDWQLYAVYADEGITGTSTKKRAQFNRMIRDARMGRFDLIVTKEVSRFSRNILDTIAYTRELKVLGVGVLFLTDGIHTLEPDAELRLSIMGSIAQEESRKTSARVKWGQTRQMERGVVFGRSLLGYRVEGGKISVEPEGAEIVRLIFRKYALEQKGTTVIARELREAGYRTASGGVKWSGSHLLKILKNEKYVGDLVQKKTYTPDYLTHQRKYNHGQEELVVIRDHHQPIISRQLWEQVQAEIKRRNRHGQPGEGHSNRYIFSGRIKCGCCGASFVARRRYRADGSCSRRWSCYTAASEGKAHTDAQGNAVGCDVGWSLRDDRALELLRRVLGGLALDRKRLAEDIVAAAMEALRGGAEDCAEPERLLRQLEGRRERLLDAYLGGDVDREEMLRLRDRYDRERAQLGERLEAARAEEPAETRLRDRVEAIMDCGGEEEAFYRHLLDRMVVCPDRRIRVQLRGLHAAWVFGP